MPGGIQVYKLHTTTTGNAGANMDIPEDGDIVFVQGMLTGLDLDTDGDRVEAELSFLSTGQQSTNDARGTIAQLEIGGQVETLVGVANMRADCAINLNPDGIPVAAGERLYIHSSISTGVTVRITFLVYIRHKSVSRRPRRLR